jgi:hypothetical protein
VNDLGMPRWNRTRPARNVMTFPCRRRAWCTGTAQAVEILVLEADA